ncbi:MAG: IS1 family transposase [Alphaproteobacteria bacterium]|nr:IS1 family transposase [Alphaproteobacteria bacterium]
MKQLQCDEIWAFCQAKRSNVARMKKPSLEAGDVWTFTALDADSKLIVTWFSGDRDYRNTRAFLTDAAKRIVSPVQVSTDGFAAYRAEMSDAFGWDASFATIQKNYTGTPDGSGPSKKYSPGVIVSQTKDVVFGAPDMAKASTSYVERQNLNIRMGNRRFTRLTNGFSRRLENHSHSLAIYFFHHNFCRIQKSLRVTPAMQAGVSDTLMTMNDLVRLVDMLAEPPKARGPYKKRSLVA